MKSYEAMFLMDPAMATDEAAAEAEIRRLLGRAEANVLGVKKWDERKLAYPIGPNKRGLYMLCFFEASPEKIAPLERDAQLSEKTVRVIILRHDKLTPETIEKAFNAPPPPKAPSRGDVGAAGASGSAAIASAETDTAAIAAIGAARARPRRPRRSPAKRTKTFPTWIPSTQTTNDRLRTSGDPRGARSNAWRTTTRSSWPGT